MAIWLTLEKETVMHRLATLATVVMLLASLAPAALAQGKGKGKNGSGTTAAAFGISLAMVEDANGDGLPNWNDHVSFDVGTAVENPFISLSCYQGTSWVLAAAYPASWTFNLAAVSWTGGDADCTATLYTTTDGRRTTTLATLAIHVDE